jgi:hydrogenase nickel incorporation protein HypA/HybF
VHEMSIAQNIVDIVLQHLPQEVDGAVHSVKIRLGRLSGVVPESLDFCFGAIISDTPLQGAQLEIDRVPVQFRCTVCQEVTTSEDAYVCPSCGGTSVHFLSGTELEVAEIMVKEPSDH